MDYADGIHRLQWSLEQTFHAEDDDEPIRTLSWGSSTELLVGNSFLSLWFLNDNPRLVWKKKLANLVKFAEFSPDAELVASTGTYDRLVKVWRRLSWDADDTRFEVSYLPHPAAVTGIHWRKPCHKDQSMENVLYTLCADNKIRVWVAAEPQCLSTLQLWTEIDMNASIQPRKASNAQKGGRRYGFIIDSRDFTCATERAVQRSTSEKLSPALEHLIEVANKNPEICVVIDDQGHMSAWALENVGNKSKAPVSVFNILHIEGVHFSFMPGLSPDEDYAQFRAFSGEADDSIIILAHHFDGRIEWLDSHVDVLFDPTQRKDRLALRATWSGHTAPIKKIVRSASGHVIVSRTDDNKAMIWRQRPGNTGPVVSRQSTILSDGHIHRTCVIGDGNFLINLHHHSISLWDLRSFHGKQLAVCEYNSSSKPLCVLTIPTAEPDSGVAYVAAIGADMKGIAWKLHLPSEKKGQVNGQNGTHSYLRQFCTFTLGVEEEDVSYILPVDPAGPQTKASGFLDLFAADIALSYTHGGTVRTWAAKVDVENSKLDWLLTSTVETGISEPSLASGSSIRKAALVDQDRAHLTIWDTSGAQLEFEEHFSQQDVIRDLDWTSTPDMQSILAVGFPHKVVLLSQLRYDYLDSRPSWTQIREIRIRDLTPHPIGDSCWLSSGHLVIGAGNQLFIYDEKIEVSNRLVSDLRIHSHGASTVDLFEVVSRLNGPLPVYHPQFLAQCILGGKVQLVHAICLHLHKKLKFFTEGDDIDTFLEMPPEDFYNEADVSVSYLYPQLNN